MSDVPALGAFCFQDSILIDKMRTTAARQTKCIRELESMLATMNEAAEESARWHKDQEAEVKRLRKEVENAYAEAWCDAGGSSEDEGQRCWAISDAKKALEDGE